MNDTSDIIFLMAAMVLFSIMVMNSNRLFLRNATMLTESEVEYSAISIAQSMIDEARTKAFDEVTVAAGPVLGNPDLFSPSDIPYVFTAPNSLGPDEDETYPNFNDFDDYHGLSITRSTGYGDFTILVEVRYINTANPDVSAGVRTTAKRMTVVVTNPLLPNSVTLNYVRTYY